MRGDVMAMYYAGEDADQIARKFIPGPSEATIKKWIKIETRQWRRGRKGGDFPWEIIEAALSCVNSGFTQMETADLIGINQTTISSWCRKAKENKIGGGGVRGFRSEKALRQRVAQLAYCGMSPADIAKLLHMRTADARQYAIDANVHVGKYSRTNMPMPTIPIQFA